MACLFINQDLRRVMDNGPPLMYTNDLWTHLGIQKGGISGNEKKDALLEYIYTTVSLYLTCSYVLMVSAH